MKNLTKESRKPPERVLDSAKRFFGPDGLGLTIKEQGGGAIRFEGGFGFVEITAHRSEGVKRTTVDLISREWDFPAEQFLSRV